MQLSRTKREGRERVGKLKRAIKLTNLADFVVVSRFSDWRLGKNFRNQAMTHRI